DAIEAGATLEDTRERNVSAEEQSAALDPTETTSSEVTMWAQRAERLSPGTARRRGPRASGSGWPSWRSARRMVRLSNASSNSARAETTSQWLLQWANTASRELRPRD